MGSLFALFLVLMAGVLFQEVSRKAHLPWVVALMIGGFLIGPSGVGLIAEPDSTIAFLGQIGLIFLMFMAGLETRLKDFWKAIKHSTWVIILTLITSVLAGMVIGYWFGFPNITALFIGVVFISSSVAVSVPYLEDSGLINAPIGRTVVASAVTLDVISLVFLAFVMDSAVPLSPVGFPSLVVSLLGIFLVLKFILPLIKRRLQFLHEATVTEHERETQLVIAVLIGLVVLFEVIGLHPILAGFFAGIVLSDVVWTRKLMEKIRMLSYGLFIPVFFVMVGIQFNLSPIMESFKTKESLLLIISFILIPIITRYLSSFWGARIEGFSRIQSKFIAASLTPQLSTTLAVALTGQELGILDAKLTSLLVVMSIATTVVGALISQVVKKEKLFI